MVDQKPRPETHGRKRKRRAIEPEAQDCTGAGDDGGPVRRRSARKSRTQTCGKREWAGAQESVVGRVSEKGKQLRKRAVGEGRIYRWRQKQRGANRGMARGAKPGGAGRDTEIIESISR